MNEPQLLMTIVLVVVVLVCLAGILYISFVWD